ncbi:MAG: acetyl-CoA carboxylase biotin carboxyl carrier protein [bacterium]
MKIEMDYIEKLVKLLCENELTELSLEEGEKAIIIKKEKEIITAQVAPTAQSVTVQPQISATQAEVSKSTVAATLKNRVSITSPMVGTFYRASSPGATPFADVGKNVNTGQVVCIIEAMKLMNEIESEVSGKVVEICVQDGQPVEYGQVLIIVEP